MIDREKVIKGLNHCFHGQECCGDTECPYYIERLSDCCLEYCKEDLKADVLAMLKEQEEVEPIIMDHMVFGTSRKCSKCNRYVFPAGRFCPHCGRKVKWDD